MSSDFRRTFFDLPDRRTIMAVSAVAGAAFITLLTLILDPHGRAAQLILDLDSPHFRYPFTIQNLEHVAFAIGLGELYVRWRVATRELGFLDQKFLPEDPETVLQFSDLGPIHRRVAKLSDGEHGFVPSLIDLGILQFQSGRSIDQTVAVMQQSLELIEHRVDLRYSIIRYIAWLIPTMGFIGTVIGLGSTLAAVPKSGDIEMYKLAHNLSVGFDCTMVALAESAVLVFLLSLVQEKEERSVNLAGNYCLRNLVNRLYVGEPESPHIQRLGRS